MPILKIPNVAIKGISACVPSMVEDNLSLSQFKIGDIEKLIQATGIHRRHICGDTDICTSDLCFKAAEVLINDLNWNRSEIDALIFVTQTPDHLLPATSTLLQQRLGLSTRCFTLDISLGCSGYIYGLSVLASMMQSGNIKKGLLLVGDTISRICSKNDKSTYPLFGDAGTASALHYETETKGITCDLNSDGSGAQAIIVPGGGLRKAFNKDSLKEIETEPGIVRSQLQLALDGMDVFSFGISKAPQTVNDVINAVGKTTEEIDYFVFHQANMMMNETIRKKLKLPKEKVPYSLENFGNTSSATIPLTIVTELQKIENGKQIVLCGFGVGLSWGSLYFESSDIHLSKLVSYE